MRHIIAVLFFLILPATIALTIHRKVSKQSIWVYVFLFYVEFFLVFITAVKAVTGEGNYTIWESFSENGNVTYARYLGLLIFVAVVLPFVLKRLFKENIEQVTAVAASISLGLYLCVYLVTGKIVNKLCVLITLLGILIALVLAEFKKDVDLTLNKETIKHTMVLCLPFLFFLTFSVVFSVPNKLYLTNPAEFHISYINYLGALLIGLTIIIVGLLFIVVVIPPNIVELYMSILFGLTYFERYALRLFARHSYDIPDI